MAPKTAASTVAPVDSIAHYATADIKDINEELADAGIDPTATIAEVKNLVAKNLAERRK